MDMSLVTAAIGLQNGQLQQAMAMRMLKMNAQAEIEAVQTLLGAPATAPSQAGLAPGVGSQLDITA